MDHGLQPISFNSPGEIDPALYPGVTFVDTYQTTERVMKAPYVLISAMMDHARSESMEHAVIINSDIQLTAPIDAYLEQSRQGLVFANRHDHNGDNLNPTRYDHGFDAFIIHRDHFHLIPRSMFCMGQTWWDYWIPYRFIRAGIPTFLVQEVLFLHHRHPVQYEGKEWERMTEHFVWIEGLRKGQSPSQLTADTFRTITKHAHRHLHPHLR